jgi:peptidyl-prolyl cis-trans isomerase B (cyclophilin B)
VRRTTTALVTLGVGVALAGCGGSSSGGADNPIVANNSDGPSSSSSPSALSTCPVVPTPKATPQHYASEPSMCTQPADYTATIKTNQGTIVATLDGAKAPHTVNSFNFLAGQGFFNNTPCHRLVTQGIFVLQCGDPTGSGTGGPGYTIPDENLAGATYPAGTLAMANTGQPHTGGSQFFFCYADTPLPPQYTPFGHVAQGLDVLKAIAAKGEDDSNGPGDGKPKKPVIIESFTVVKA